MGVADTTKTVAEKINSPWINLAIIVTMAATMVAGTKWGIAMIADTQSKADSALQAVTKVQGAMDTFIMLQREANALKREEMVAQGIRIQTKTVSVEESSSQSSSSSSSKVTSSNTTATAGLVVVEYKEDSVRKGIFRVRDTLFVPVVDSTGHRPR